jgi:hypothetical protein
MLLKLHEVLNGKMDCCLCHGLGKVSWDFCFELPGIRTNGFEVKVGNYDCIDNISVSFCEHLRFLTS